MSGRAEFVHLHLHSEYSLLDGASRIPALVERAAALGMPAMAMTDHGAMYGALEFYQACQANGSGAVKPILGCELYVAPRSRFDKTAKVDDEPYHFVLLAKDLKGWSNLTKLVSAGFLEGFYYKPRVDRELLAEHSEGLIALSACLGAEVPQLLLQDKLREAEEAAAFYRDVFGRDGFYLELQDHGLREQRRVNRALVEMAGRLDVGLVATNDAHYLVREDAHAHDVLLCIQTAANVDQPKRLKFPSEEFYVKTPEEMAKLFGELPASLSNTLRIAEMCNLKFEFGQLHLPRYELPEGFDAPGYLRHLCLERLPGRYPDASPEVRQRLDYELDMISRMGYAGYFLIVWDFIDFARRKGIPVGPGRGSAAGSMVAYVLGITNIDPLRYGLVFERFLNPERVDMPDIDIDFCYERRDEVIRYVAEKYGADCVAQIITFGTMGAKAVLRDVGRAMGLSYGEVDKIAKLVPAQLHMTLDKAIETEPELRKSYEESDVVRRLIDVAKRLEGLPRHPSVHAAGVVISHQPLVDLVPLARTQDGNVVTQFNMDLLKEIGLLKMDFLGLRTLTVLQDAVELVRQTAGVELDLDHLPMDDGPTYRMLSEAQTSGVFQLESGGMRDMLRELKPSNIEDIIAAVALFRPGPMENIPAFVKAKHSGRHKYPHPALEPVLQDSYGVMIYQEQILRTAAVMAGFSLGDADMLRRAMGKKKKEIMDEYRERFVKGCLGNGHSEKLAVELFDLIEKFAGYGFNKCIAPRSILVDVDTGQRHTMESAFRAGARFRVASLDARGRIRPGKIADIVWNGVKPIYRLKTRTGRVIEATSTHPFRTWNGWTTLSQLKPGVRIAAPRRLFCGSSTLWSDEQVALLGYLISEGNLCHPTSFYFYAKDEAVLADYVRCLESFENTAASFNRSKSAVSVYAKRRDLKVPSAAVEWVRTLGIWDHKATEKFIPEPAFGLPMPQLELFLGKLWTGDGCIDPKRRWAYYATSSHRLARDVQHLLARLGIVGRIYTPRFRYRGGFKQGYQVGVVGPDDLFQLWQILDPHLVGHAREKLEELARLYPLEATDADAEPCRDTVPGEVVEMIEGALALDPRSPEEVARAAGMAAISLSRDARRKGYARGTLRRLANVLGSRELAQHAESDVFWDEVAAIEYVGEDDTYDLTVEGYHNFVADDIIVHNSHAAAYGVVAYQTAYLKANYPVQYMAALLTSIMGDSAKVAEYIAECRRLGVAVLPPDVNESLAKFTVVDGKVRFGLAAVKNLGLGAIEGVVRAREAGGAFTGLTDFLSRIDLRQCNRRALESLIKAGAFDSTGARRAQLMAALDGALDAAQSDQRLRASGQVSLFAEPVADELPAVGEFPQRQLLANEKEVLGIYLSGHPLESAQDRLTGVALPITDLADRAEDDRVTIGGLVAALRRATTRKGDPMAFVTLEDLASQVEVVVFPKVYETCRAQIEPDALLLIKGKVSWRDDQVTVVADEVAPLLPGGDGARAGEAGDPAAHAGQGLYVRLPESGDRLTLELVRAVLKSHPGPIPVFLHLPGQDRWFRADDRLSVTPGLELRGQLEELVGSGGAQLRPLSRALARR